MRSLHSQTATVNLAAGATVLSHTVTTATALADLLLDIGDGTNNLAAAAETTLTVAITIDSVPVRGTDATDTVIVGRTRLRIPVDTFPVAAGETVAVSITSDQAADTAVAVTSILRDASPLQPVTRGGQWSAALVRQEMDSNSGMLAVRLAADYNWQPFAENATSRSVAVCLRNADGTPAAVEDGATVTVREFVHGSTDLGPIILDQFVTVARVTGAWEPRGLAPLGHNGLHLLDVPDTFTGAGLDGYEIQVWKAGVTQVGRAIMRIGLTRDTANATKTLLDAAHGEGSWEANVDSAWTEEQVADFIAQLTSVYTVTSQIVVSDITILTPDPGTADLNIDAGNDYLTSEGTALQVPVNTSVDLTGKTILFAADSGELEITGTGAVVSAVEPKSVSIDITAADSNRAGGRYAFEVLAVSASGKRHTIRRGIMNVRDRIVAMA